MNSPAKSIPKRDSLILGMSSEDSAGTDSSFDSIQENVSSNSSIQRSHQHKGHDIKMKHDSYSRYINSLTQKTKEMNNPNTSWLSLYYNFFNASTNTSKTTLNELNLRCKFLFKYDTIEKDSKKRANSCNQSFHPYTNINHFLKYFSEKKYDNYSSKLILKAKTSSLQRSIRKKESVLSTELRNNDGEPNQNKLIQYNLLTLYNIKEPNEIVACVNKKNSIYSKDEKMKKRIENMNYILNNKNAYQVEIENYKKNGIINDDKKFKEIYDTFLDFKSNESFFVLNTDEDLIQKYKNRMEESEKIGHRINNFTQNVIKKIDTINKLDF